MEFSVDLLNDELKDNLVRTWLYQENLVYPKSEKFVDIFQMILTPLFYIATGFLILSCWLGRDWKNIIILVGLVALFTSTAIPVFKRFFAKRDLPTDFDVYLENVRLKQAILHMIEIEGTLILEKSVIKKRFRENKKTS